MLKDNIAEVRSEIMAGRFANEAAVRQGVVLRLLHALGWPTYNTRVVAPEYSVGGRRVDLALCHPPEKPVVLIEIKQLGLSDGAEQQLFEYAFHQGVPMVVLTDGQQWHFFLPAEQGNYAERRVYKLDLVERDLADSASRLESYMQYERICSGEALQAARTDYQAVTRAREIRATLPAAWRKLVEDEEPLLLELLAEQVESICGYKPTLDAAAAFLKETLVSAPPAPVSPTGPRTIAPTVTAEPGRARIASPTTAPGQIGYSLGGTFHPGRSARAVLVSVFVELGQRDATFYERFAALPKHGRTRRYLARNRDELNPGRSDLASEFSHKLSGGWWLGTNESRASIARIIEAACNVAGLRYEHDLKLSLGS